MCLPPRDTLGDHRPNNPSGYNLIKSVPVRQDVHERGTAILISNRVNYKQLHLNTSLQDVAASLHLNKQYTICSLHLPHLRTEKQEIEHLLRQLPQPYILLGDMNAKSPLWEKTIIDARGRIFEELLIDLPISLLNDNSPTHYHVQTATSSVIDLSLCSSDCALNFSYSTVSDLHGSDHYPIILSLHNTVSLFDSPDRFQISRADWTSFTAHTNTNLSVNHFNNIDALLTTLACIQDYHRSSSIYPIIVSGSRACTPVPWFNNECKAARRAERAYKRHRDINYKIAYNEANPAAD